MGVALVLAALLAFLAARLAGLGVRAADGTAPAPGRGEPPRWWKGNLHTHTLWSDGDGFPEMIAEGYRDRGYHFLAFSDHNVFSLGDRWMAETQVLARARGEPWKGAAHEPRNAVADYLARFGPDWVERRAHPGTGVPEIRLKPFDEVRARVESAGRFLLVAAEEITHKARNDRVVHMGAVNLFEPLGTREGATVPEVISNVLRAARDAASRRGRQVLVHVNHPNYKWGVTAEDLAAVVDERFFEVWNGVDGDNDPGDARHPSTEEIWDIANALRIAGFGAPPLFALATDDSHDHQGNKSRSPPGRAWVMVRARHLTPESLVRALERGEFYATTGVELEDVRFEPEARRLALRIRSQPGETYVTRFVGTRRGVDLRGRPRLDSDGRVIETTLDYRTETGPPMGETLAEVEGRTPEYRFRGDELYVRSVVTSSGRPEVPSTEQEFKRAWTQPVGWERELPASPPPGR